MTTNQVLIATNANKYIVHAMNRRSEIIRDNLKLRNNNIQVEKDAINMSQQQTSSWNALPAEVLEQVILNSTNPTFVVPGKSDQEEATVNETDPENSTVDKTAIPTTQLPPTRYSQKIVDLRL